MDTKQKIIEAVTEAYIATPGAVTIVEIAAMPDTPSESTIRKHIWDIVEFDVTKKDIVIRDSNYRFHKGTRSVDAFVPTRRHLASIIQDARQFATRNTVGENYV